MKTLVDRLVEIEPVGNAMDDAELFRLAHIILIGDEYDMAAKFVALRKIDAAIGDEGEISEHAVEEYCRQTLCG